MQSSDRAAAIVNRFVSVWLENGWSHDALVLDAPSAPITSISSENIVHLPDGGIFILPPSPWDLA
jgi:hypothetical protein